MFGIVNGQPNNVSVDDVARVPTVVDKMEHSIGCPLRARIRLAQLRDLEIREVLDDRGLGVRVVRSDRRLAETLHRVEDRFGRATPLPS
jgi:hypothetical protein